MALIRGSLSNHPCPVCLVHKSEMANLSASLKAVKRTIKDSDCTVTLARELSTKKEAERLLQSKGARNVMVYSCYIYIHILTNKFYRMLFYVFGSLILIWHCHGMVYMDMDLELVENIFGQL